MYDTAMGTKERRIREREQQRQKILNASLTIVTKEGFAGLSMRKLAEQIEYSPASIYLHFASREQIAKELRELGFKTLLTLMEDSLAEMQGRDALLAMASAYVSFGIDRPELYQLIFMGDAGFSRAAHAEGTSGDAADRAYALLLRVAHGMEGAPLSKTAGTVIADVIWASLHGIVSLHLASPGLQTTSPTLQTNLFVELIAKGLVYRNTKKRPSVPLNSSARLKTQTSRHPKA